MSVKRSTDKRVRHTSKASGASDSGAVSSKEMFRLRVGWSSIASIGTITAWGTAREAVSISINSASSFGRRSDMIKIPPPPAYFSDPSANVEGGICLPDAATALPAFVLAETALTGWYRSLTGKEIYASWVGVTREKLGRTSNAGSSSPEVLSCQNQVQWKNPCFSHSFFYWEKFLDVQLNQSDLH